MARSSVYLFGVLLCALTSSVAAEVVVTGVNGAAKTNILLMLALTKENCAAPTWKIQGLFNHAEQDIDDALRALGYYHATVKKTLTLTQSCWRAEFNVSVGTQTRLRAVEVVLTGTAQTDKKFIQLLKKLPLKAGDALNHANYEQLKNKIETLALERGYLHGHFIENSLLIDSQHNSADIKLVYAAEQRFIWGAIRIEQDILDPEFVNQYLAINSGDFYSGEQLVETHNALSKSGYFDSIDMRPDLAHSVDNRVPITLKLTPKSRHHYSFGVGYDTDIGPLFNSAYLNRRLNRQGHFLSANFDLSPVLSTIDAEYTIPLAHPVSDFFSVGGGVKREDTSSYQSLAATLSARLKHAYHSGWKQTLFLDYSIEEFDTGISNRQTLLLIPGGNWLLSVANNTLRPSRGHRIEFETKASYHTPFSDVSFIQGYLSAVWLHKLPLHGKLIGRTEQGVMAVDQFDNLPTTYRFYAGGINSVRGYAYKELGPKDNLGQVIGGKLLSVFSVEYEQALFDDWALAAFVDSGNAFNLDNIGFKTGAGVGVRWYSPLGPLRIDVALPLNPSESTFQIHFAAGTRL